jgi:hypothetical protein
MDLFFMLFVVLFLVLAGYEVVQHIKTIMFH